MGFVAPRPRDRQLSGGSPVGRSLRRVLFCVSLLIPPPVCPVRGDLFGGLAAGAKSRANLNVCYFCVQAFDCGKADGGESLFHANLLPDSMGSHWQIMLQITITMVRCRDPQKCATICVEHNHPGANPDDCARGWHFKAQNHFQNFPNIKTFDLVFRPGLMFGPK